MANKSHIDDLSEDERAELGSFVSSSVHRAEDVTRARILFKADDGATDLSISRAWLRTINALLRTQALR